MAISLPPPLPPQQGALTELRAEAGHEQALSIDYKSVHIRIFGSRLVPEQRLRAAIAAAATLSDAVRSIGYAYYSGGYPATVLSYAAEKDTQVTVYVRVVPGRVSAVTGPAELLDYFKDLPRHAPLTDAQLEADRNAADAVAQRGGLQYQPVFKPAGADAVTLDLGEAKPGDARFSAAASFNNYGNRYAGPYLGNLGLRQSFSSGDEFTATGSSSLRFLGSGNDGAGPYYGGNGSWMRATRLGELGLAGSYASFQETTDGVTFKGKLYELEASWRYVLLTDFRQRLSLEARWLHDHEALGEPETTTPVSCDALDDLLVQLGLESCEAVQHGGDALSENYHSAELALSYVWRSLEWQHPLELQAGALLRKGLGAGSTAGSPADLSYLLWQASLSLRYDLTSHLNLLAGGNAQFSDAVLPQQQQFVIGGPTNLHAFLVGAGVGDRGETANVSAEWRGDQDGWMEHWGLRPRLFVEYASVTHRQPVLGEPSGSVSLADAGAAVDIRFLEQLGGSLSVGRPAAKHGEQFSPDQLETRLLFFQLAAKF